MVEEQVVQGAASEGGSRNDEVVQDETLRTRMRVRQLWGKLRSSSSSSGARWVFEYRHVRENGREFTRRSVRDEGVNALDRPHMDRERFALEKSRLGGDARFGESGGNSPARAQELRQPGSWANAKSSSAPSRTGDSMFRTLSVNLGGRADRNKIFDPIPRPSRGASTEGRPRVVTRPDDVSFLVGDIHGTVLGVPSWLYDLAEKRQWNHNTRQRIGPGHNDPVLNFLDWGDNFVWQAQSDRGALQLPLKAMQPLSTPLTEFLGNLGTVEQRSEKKSAVVLVCVLQSLDKPSDFLGAYTKIMESDDGVYILGDLPSDFGRGPTANKSFQDRVFRKTGFEEYGRLMPYCDIVDHGFGAASTFWPSLFGRLQLGPIGKGGNMEKPGNLRRVMDFLYDGRWDNVVGDLGREVQFVSEAINQVRVGRDHAPYGRVVGGVAAGDRENHHEGADDSASNSAEVALAAEAACWQRFRVDLSNRVNENDGTGAAAHSAENGVEHYERRRSDSAPFSAECAWLAADLLGKMFRQESGESLDTGNVGTNLAVVVARNMLNYLGVPVPREDRTNAGGEEDHVVVGGYSTSILKNGGCILGEEVMGGQRADVVVVRRRTGG